MSMDYEATIRWLSRRVRVLSAQRMLGGFLMLLGGAALLVATWGLCYVVSFFALGGWIGHQHWFHSVLGLFVIPILFVGNARTSREYLSEYSVTTGTASGEVVNAVEAMNPVVVFPQLQEIDGVLFLKAEPAGLSLSSELKAELTRSE